MELRRRPLPEALAADSREARTPLPLPPGLRSFGRAGEAAEADRWRGLGSLARTEAMLGELAEAMVAACPQPAAGQAPRGRLRDSLARLLAHDFAEGGGETRLWTGDGRRPLMLAALYGDGPEESPELYGRGQGRLAPWRLRRRSARGGAGPLSDPRAARPAAERGGGEIADGLFVDLHDLALSRLARIGADAARFAAARRATRALHRRAVFEDLLPVLARPDVVADCAARPGPEDAVGPTEETPCELVHLGLPLLPACRLAASGLGAVLCGAVEAGALSAASLARAVRPRLARLAAGAPWLATDDAALSAAVADWAARHAPQLAGPLTADPPPGFVLWLERQAPAAVGGGDGRRLGALGSAIVAECLWALRRQTAEDVEDAPDLPLALAAIFPFGDPGPGVMALDEALGTGRGGDSAV